MGPGSSVGGVGGGRLAAAVSNAGGLGLVGGGYGDPDWMHAQLRCPVRDRAALGCRPDYLVHHPRGGGPRVALSPAAVLLSFGDIRPYAPAIKAAGCTLLCQIQEVEAAREAVAAGADIIVAQGSEAGGHVGSRRRSRWSRPWSMPSPRFRSWRPAVSPMARAGGGAHAGGAWRLMGTRFSAASESLTHTGQGSPRRRSCRSHRQDSHLDIVRGYASCPSRTRPASCATTSSPAGTAAKTRS